MILYELLIKQSLKKMILILLFQSKKRKKIDGSIMKLLELKCAISNYLIKNILNYKISEALSIKNLRIFILKRRKQSSLGLSTFVSLNWIVEFFMLF